MTVDRQFADGVLAALYDSFCPWTARGDFSFYFPLVMRAGAVLDVGCGTGALLIRAREQGHTGRLCGLDPGAGMLEQARRRQDIEWVIGDLSTAAWDSEFDLVVMTGHAFQVFVDDEELSQALAAIRRALRPGGRFAFETRNPAVRAWEQWTPDRAVEVLTPAGQTVRLAHEVDGPVKGDIVSFTSTYTSPSWPHPELSRSRLRFLGEPALTRFLSAAGLAIEDRFGDWDCSPLSATSPEIITIARRASSAC